ncbi:hypothetical protein FBALC1_07838 [Flavobacteriales bacterium ALC-1]|nr:hypothetical protein FBALC1_07838 [Flavobacteriales bacterium ALC-1]
MAFGMQKRVYKPRPRKPFSKRRKVSFAAAPKYKRDFKYQPSNNRGDYNFSILLFIVIAIIVSIMIPRWVEYERIKHRQEVTLTTKKDNKVFEFLMKSGKKRLDIGAISGAYSEFQLAYAIRPEDIELNELLFETLEILCIDYDKHCSNYNKLKNK